MLPQDSYSMDDLLRVMQRLRDPESGCPWDVAQDFRSIVPSTLEECYELAAAIEHEDYRHVAEELGDVLFQVVFYAQMGSEQALFDFNQVVSILVAKLLRRHPHVFLDGEIEGVVEAIHSVDDVKQSWESIKRRERKDKAQPGVLDDVPVALPSLPRAQKLQKRAATVGFDWSRAEDVLVALEQEIAELREAMNGADQAAVEDEFGDLLFSAANLARHLGLDAESSLRGASAKFEGRFRAMESAAREAGHGLEELSANELEVLWQRAKKRFG
jgi:ATP diphosphatase